MKIAVIGLGKLGLCTSGCFASKGHKVTGIDINEETVDKLLRREIHIQETNIEHLMEKAWDNLDVYSDFNEGLDKSQPDVIMIIVPTPSKDNGAFDNSYVNKALGSIAMYLRVAEKFTVVDVVSTVMPQSCDEFVLALEALSGKVCGEDFGFVYNPEFIALGNVIKSFLNPDMVLIGASDDKSANIVHSLYKMSVENDPHYAIMNLVNAEITKLINNCYCTTKVTFANHLANICERVPNADVDEITNAIGHDSRIGLKCLMAGLGFYGPCWPRDNQALIKFAHDVGSDAKLAKTVVEINDSLLYKMMRKIESNIEGKEIALFGLSYKPDTPHVFESHTIDLIYLLLNKGYDVAVHDPQALDEVMKIFGDRITYFDDPLNCVIGRNGLVLMTNWPEYHDLDWLDIYSLMCKNDGNSLLIDSWRIVPKDKRHLFNYIGIGLGK